MKLLSGKELAGFIKERQAKAVRGLRQAHHIYPKLAIIVTVEDPVIEIYMRLKRRYGADILIDVDIHRVAQNEVLSLIERLNHDDSVHGIIVQLPLSDPAETEAVVNAVAPHKDVDALGAKASLDPATPTAILWLLAGYNIQLGGRRVVILGRGKLVGQPLERMLQASGVNATALDTESDIAKELSTADIIISATGQPGLVTAAMVPPNAVVVDAGVAVESGRAIGDLALDVYERPDITLTPQKGGVGPLTVCALFENVINAAKLTASIKS